ncbi:2Fe-2S iron-sulfur cluster-binding protein [Paraherbaspirillum soli]|uniref:2Fe-2S iron-sulfur cluster-binding protein n=1 Tax=Paraherbaspirillum soli TaxID=631222 RepID=A0ABW0M6T9_9BURK
MFVTNGRFSVLIEPKGWEFEAADAVSLLGAAQLADISLPSSCRNGTCRTCMCRLISGRIRHNIEWPGLSAEEKKEGFILPCVAYPESDLIIDEPRAARRVPSNIPGKP